EADLAAAIEQFVADPGGLAGLRVDMREVRELERQFLLDDAAGIAHAGRLMPTGHVDALHKRAAIGRKDTQDLALLALVAAADDDDVVVFFDLQLQLRLRHRFHSTSGASETIFMKRRARSSRVTGPRMRWPIGSPWRLIRTAGLRSKRIARPSSRRISLAVRTMTARCTSPFLTRPRGIASLTDTMMTSPTVAVLRFEPPSTLMHCTRRAPELSATSRLVCIWIMWHRHLVRWFRRQGPVARCPSDQLPPTLPRRPQWRGGGQEHPWDR